LETKSDAATARFKMREPRDDTWGNEFQTELYRVKSEESEKGEREKESEKDFEVLCRID
jgi:hypothetical protein